MREIQDFGCFTTNGCGANDGRSRASDFDIEEALYNVDDLRYQKTHRLTAHTDNQHGPMIPTFPVVPAAAKIDDGHQGIAMHHHELPVEADSWSFLTLSMREISDSGKAFSAPAPARKRMRFVAFFLRRQIGEIGIHTQLVRTVEADTCGKAGRVHDQHDRAIAEDRAAGIKPELRQGAVQGFTTISCTSATLSTVSAKS